MINKILIPVADQCFLPAIEEFVMGLQAADDALTLRLLHAMEPAGELSTVTKNVLIRDGNELLDSLSKSLKAKFPYQKIETIIVDGNPKDAILEEANDWSADLILLGPHTKHGLGSLLLGSVAASVIPDAPCDVVLLRNRKEDKAGPISVSVEQKVSN